MVASEFPVVIVTGVILIAISMTLDLVWARTIPSRLLYYCVRAPGVIVHECTHVAGCLVMGAKVQKVVLFSEKGGSVSYNKPIIPYIGDVVISMAPLFGIPLVILGITWVFRTYSGCYFPSFPLYFDTIRSVQELFADILSLFYQNLVVHLNIWFFLYLYLTMSLAVSIAPSGQDIKNAAIGIAIILGVGILVVWSNIPFVVNALLAVTRILGMGISLGFVFGLIAFIVSIPLIIVYSTK
jgi:hypothetical protein